MREIHVGLTLNHISDDRLACLVGQNWQKVVLKRKVEEIKSAFCRHSSIHPALPTSMVDPDGADNHGSEIHGYQSLSRPDPRLSKRTSTIYKIPLPPSDPNDPCPDGMCVVGVAMKVLQQFQRWSGTRSDLVSFSRRRFFGSDQNQAGSFGVDGGNASGVETGQSVGAEGAPPESSDRHLLTDGQFRSLLRHFGISSRCFRFDRIWGSHFNANNDIYPPGTPIIHSADFLVDALSCNRYVVQFYAPRSTKPEGGAIGHCRLIFGYKITPEREVAFQVFDAVNEEEQAEGDQEWYPFESLHYVDNSKSRYWSSSVIVESCDTGMGVAL